MAVVRDWGRGLRGQVEMEGAWALQSRMEGSWDLWLPMLTVVSRISPSAPHVTVRSWEFRVSMEVSKVHFV